jgi:citrate lyase subunit beta/citryl-CoA lyase
MRSLLFVPGDSPRKLEKGTASGADVIIVDLEDSVAAAKKETARGVAADFITTASRQGGAPRIYVRVNDLSTGLTDGDLGTIVKARPDGIMLPKCNAAADIWQLAAMLRVHEAEAGIEDGATRIIAIITETALGVLSAASYRETIPRLAGLTWGAEDLSAAIGATPRDGDGRHTDVFRLARAVTVLAAAASDVAAIDTVFVNFRESDGLRQECREAARDGFTAKMAIHPDQVAIINEVFTPSTEAVAEAKAVIKAFADAGNPGVVGIGGKMYDRPHLRRAERLLARAGASIIS